MLRTACLLCISLRLIFSLSYAETPTYIVKKAPQSITANGALDELLWSCLDSVSLEECTAGGAPPTQWTKAKAAWDIKHLYLAIVTQDRDVWATITTHDGALFTEEMLEFFIDPDRDGKNYFEYEFNCKNALMDMFMKAPYGTPGGGGDPSWTSSNIGFKAVVNGTANNPGDIDSGMVLEAKIPWADLKFNTVAAPQPSHGVRMSVNIYRGDGRATKYYSCWSPVGGNLPGSFHSPQLFGTFEFSDSLAAPKTGVNSCPKTVAAPGGMAIEWVAAGNRLSIRYNVPRSTSARIILSDLLGKTVFRTSVAGDDREHSLLCNKEAGHSSGIYLLRLQSREGTVIRRVAW